MGQNAYIEIMIQSQKKKIKIIENLISLSKDQEELFSAEIMDYDRFQQTLSKKEEFINQLNELDQGFASLFERVKEEIKDQKDVYKDQIKTLQDSIISITSKSVILETIERRNKVSMERYSRTERSKIRQRNISQKTLTNYYKSASSGQGAIFNQKK